jgi:hypothetical protein
VTYIPMRVCGSRDFFCIVCPARVALIRVSFWGLVEQLCLCRMAHPCVGSPRLQTHYATVSPLLPCHLRQQCHAETMGTRVERFYISPCHARIGTHPVSILRYASPSNGWEEEALATRLCRAYVRITSAKGSRENELASRKIS